MCGPLLWGFWWIFPLVGFLICLVMAFGFASAGRGFMCMGGHRAGHSTAAGRPGDLANSQAHPLDEGTSDASDYRQRTRKA